MKTIKIIICFALSLFLVNCSKDKEIENPDITKEEVKLHAEINNIEIEALPTRAITKFDEKEFQLIVRDNSGSNFFTEKSTIAKSDEAEVGKVESPVVVKPKLYWDDLGGKSADLELFGIYPNKKLVEEYGYSENNINWSVTTDIIASDLLLAHKASYPYSKTAKANLVFEHVLTKVSINLIEGKGFDDEEGEEENNKEDLSNATVTFKVPTQGTCNIKTGVATGTDKATGTLAPTKVDNSFTILTFPFKVENEGNTYELAVITTDKNTYKVNVKDMDLVKGAHNIFNVTINKSDVTLTASVKGWEEKASNGTATLVNIGAFTIADSKDDEVTSGTTIALAITDGEGASHERVFTYKDAIWTPNEPLYWDDMAYPLAKVDALMVLGGAANKDKGDYIFTASASNVGLQGSIPLGEFIHPLVRLTITVTTSTPSAEVTDNVNLGGIQKIVINESTPFTVDGATIKQEDKEDDGSNALEAIKDEDSETEYTYVAFMTPKELTKLCDITIKEDAEGKNINVYPVEFKDKVSFEAGKHYKYTVKITKTDVKLTGSLVDWIPVENDEIKTGL